jgi:predicted membrane protein
MKKDYTKLVLGSILLIIGISLLFGQLGLEQIFGFSFGYLFSLLWPTLLIIIGLSIWIGSKSRGGIILIIIGLLFLMNILFDVNVWSLFWPIILITIGFAILLKGTTKSTKTEFSEDSLNISSIFTGIDKKINSKIFKEAKIFTMFGGTELDLRKAGFDNNEAEIDLTVIFGGVTITVPENVVVKSEGSAFLGAWENKADSSTDKKSPVLKIRGSVMFGGVEIK